MELKGSKLQHKLDWMVWHQSRNRVDNKKLAFNQIKINFLMIKDIGFSFAKITVYGSNEKNGF
jgi:hypothetical protein